MLYIFLSKAGNLTFYGHDECRVVLQHYFIIIKRCLIVVVFVFLPKNCRPKKKLSKRTFKNNIVGLKRQNSWEAIKKKTTDIEKPRYHVRFV